MCRRSFIAAATLMSLLFLPTIVFPQNDGEDYETWKKRTQAEYSNYKRQQQEDYSNFRKKTNADYAEFVKKHWEEMQAFKGVKPPQPEPVPPVVIPEEDRQKERKDEPKPFEEIVVVEPPEPQPTPIEPIVPVDPVKPKQEKIATNFFGTRMECTVETRPKFALTNTNEEAIGNAWGVLSNGQCDNLLSQCLELRGRYRLNDWGYIQLLDSISHVCCQRANEATLLMAWLYCQSGYKMRLARGDNRLYMLFASENFIYFFNYYVINNELFYCYKGEGEETLYVCDVAFPKEQTMTLRMSFEPLLVSKASKKRTLRSEQYPELTLSTTVNRNLIDFYNNYPTGSLTEDFGTRWAMYANTPLSEEARNTLYPRLKKILSGKSKLEATERLLNFVQTAFVYEYDDKVWGGDRAFFAEETLFYPYADCEDRSILFSRLVRDLLGLRVVLIYYPGHLATAVRFEGNQQPNGDYLQLEDGNYFIADPTYIGAPIGISMPDIREQIKNVIVLK